MAFHRKKGVLLVYAVSSGKNVCGVNEGSSAELAVVPVDSDDPGPLVLISRPSSSNLELRLQCLGHPVKSLLILAILIVNNLLVGNTTLRIVTAWGWGRGG